jgi:phosphatidylethanolamine-binding protein (PEBP) family uncharacterized protein
MKHLYTFLVFTVCGFALSACNNDNTHEFTLTSSDMADGGVFPLTYTCDGQSISPPLSWRGAPADTQAYALIMDHVAPEGMHWYWTLYNIDAANTHVAAGETVGHVGTNSVNDLNQYAPPCSKGPGEKTYTFSMYALSALANLPHNKKVDRATLLAAIKDITLDSSSINVHFERQGNHLPPSAQRKQKPPRKAPVNQPDKTYLTANVNSPRCDLVRESVNQAGFEQRVSVTCDDEYAYIASSTYPNHLVMTGIKGTNEQVPVPTTDYAAPIKLHPNKADTLTTIDAAVGVAVNGVPIYDYSSQGELDVYNYDEKHDTLALGQLDNCGGHAGRGDDYHYHVAPTCMIDTMKNKTSNPIIGWAYDGYPLYGNHNPDGSSINTSELDVCNGQADDTFGYRYQTSTTPPYIIQCLVGKVNTQKLPRVSPLSGDTQGMRADLRPPRKGVENLTHTTGKNGSRTMRYSYQGENYYTTYSPSSKGRNCYDFKQKTISNGAKVETGTFCRGQQPANHSPAPLTVKNTINTAITGKHHFKLEAWADNWFSAYIGEQLLVEDSVPITTERSFNAESILFSTNYPITLNVILKDFKQNDTGLEYIGARNQQMGDGGFIMQLTDTDTNNVVAVSNNNWKCEVLHKAPLNKLCEAESNPVAGEGYCTFMSKAAPTNWLSNHFDDAAWANATEHTASSVGPKDGYKEINWNPNAQFIWGEDLEVDNTLICKTTITQPRVVR